MRATRAAPPLADSGGMDDPPDILIPLLPPFLALLGQAADAQAGGEQPAHDLWLAAAGHLHAVDADALA
ncbi:hypothetical protein DWU95_24510, partial [Burkholderia contaminans]